MVDTEFLAEKKPGACPNTAAANKALLMLEVTSGPIHETIRDLVAHHVAVTSTLPVFETFVPNRAPLDARILDAMLPDARISYLRRRALISDGAAKPVEAVIGTAAAPELLHDAREPYVKHDELVAVQLLDKDKKPAGIVVQWNCHPETLFKKELEFEREFVKQGGLLLAGLDPTGYGGVIAGFGDQREVELLVEAGFTPVEAIHMATSNGAEFLGEQDKIGTLVVGKQADLVVINGDPSGNIADIEKVEIVFKDGIGYDSAKLIESVGGLVGLR